MRASLDTDIIIHLYKAGNKQLVYSLFDEVYVYEYLVEKELKNKAPRVYMEFMEDISDGLVNQITPTDLLGKSVKALFDGYVEEFLDLFDHGEMYAVALARAMGIEVLLSDDTKLYGPHDTLCRELVTDVIPFAFYELLFLRYISSAITLTELHRQFDAVSDILDHPMNFWGRMGQTTRRFDKDGTKRDRVWIERYCSDCSADLNSKLTGLKGYLKRTYLGMS
jgi:predicted nucleic acid-binding protein